MDASRMPRPTKRLRIRPHAPVNVTRYGAAAHAGAALRTWMDCPAWFAGRVHHRTRYDIRPPSSTRYGVGTAALGLTPWGLRPLRRALRDDGVFRWLRPAGISRRARRGYFARCVGRPGALPPGPLRFGLSASRWQEWSARNFASGQGVVSQPYWMYGKKPHRRHGGKGSASTADTRVVGSPHKKKIE